MMNYAQVLEQTEQLKKGKKVPNISNILDNYAFKKVLYIPEDFEYELLGEYMEALLKEHKYTVGRFTPYAIKKTVGHILYNGKSISQKEFATYGEAVLSEAEQSGILAVLTGTEVYLNVALEYFSYKNVDFLILPSNEKCDLEEITEKITASSIQTREKITENMVVSLLEKEGVVIKEKLRIKAFEKYKSEGKFELLKKKPYFIADGADGAGSVKFLMAKLQYAYPNNPYIFIVGTMQEDYEDVVRESAMMAGQIITVTPPEQANALPSIDLAQEFGKLNPNITNASSLEEAIEIATILADKETVIVAFGTTAILERYKNVVLNATRKNK